MIQNSIVFDIGRTKTRVAFSQTLEDFEEPVVFETDHNYFSGIEKLLGVIKICIKERDIKHIAGGITRALSDWQTEKLKEDLHNFSGADILIENDSAIVGLGEALYGAGKNFEIVAYITVSTGVGGVRIVGGKIDERTVGFEPGKQIIDIENGKTETLEDLVSGSALQARTGKHPKEITDPIIWEEYAKILAVGLNNIIVNWSPNCIVLGGSMIIGDPAIPIDRTENYLKEIIGNYVEIPIIKKAKLGDFGGLWGGLALINQTL